MCYYKPSAQSFLQQYHRAFTLMKAIPRVIKENTGTTFFCLLCILPSCNWVKINAQCSNSPFGGSLQRF